MKVLINAITITEGGGLVVLTRLLASMQTSGSEIVWYIAADPKILSALPQHNKIIKIPYAWARKTPAHLLYWYECELPKLVSRIKIDLLFSLTNFLPRRHVSCPSLLLIHNAGFFSETFTRLQLQYYKSIKNNVLWKRKTKWAKNSIKRATVVTVQTNALKNEILKLPGVLKNKIMTIPHGPGFLEMPEVKCRSFPDDRIWRIGYITKFGPQKDFITVIKAMRQLKTSDVRIKLVLTLDENTQEYPSIFHEIEANKIQDMIENLGEITDLENLQMVYNSLDIFVFPSLVESFGFTLVEAMTAGLPVIVADTPSNREVAGEAGHFFSTENSKQLSKKIQKLMIDKNLYYLASENSIIRSHFFSWGKAGLAMIELMHNMTRVT